MLMLALLMHFYIWILNISCYSRADNLCECAYSQLTFTEVSSLYHEIFYNAMENTSFVVQGFLSSFTNAFLTWMKQQHL